MQTVRQAFTILKQNPLLSIISILGTAFAITMIMAIVIIWQTKYADLEPEVNRSRCLYFSAMHISSKTEKRIQNYNTPSPAFMKECIQPLSEVEACTAFAPASAALVSLTDGSNRVKVDAMQTDQGSACSFWQDMVSAKKTVQEVQRQLWFVLLWHVSCLARRMRWGSSYC